MISEQQISNMVRLSLNFDSSASRSVVSSAPVGCFVGSQSGCFERFSVVFCGTVSIASRGQKETREPELSRLFSTGSAYRFGGTVGIGVFGVAGVVSPDCGAPGAGAVAGGSVVLSAGFVVAGLAAGA